MGHTDHSQFGIKSTTLVNMTAAALLARWAEIETALGSLDDEEPRGGPLTAALMSEGEEIEKRLCGAAMGPSEAIQATAVLASMLNFKDEEGRALDLARNIARTLNGVA